MAKNINSGRFVISASDLEHIARCPKSINFLGRIHANSTCKSCLGLGAAGRYMLQRSFKGTRLPTLDYLTRIYVQAVGWTSETPWILRMATQQRVILDHLRDWGRGVWEKIDAVNVAAETHHGLFTVQQLIDVILKVDGNYVLGQFSCDANHPEQILHYRTLQSSLWMRESYGLDTNNIMIIRLTPHGPEFLNQSLNLSTKILRESIETILSRVDVGFPRTADEYEAALRLLPPNPGELCHSCMACFDLENINVKAS